MSYAREPALNPDTYQRLLQTWIDNAHRDDLPQMMTLTVPRQYLDTIKRYCKERGFFCRQDGARDYRYAKLTVYKPIATEAS